MERQVPWAKEEVSEFEDDLEDALEDDERKRLESGLNFHSDFKSVTIHYFQIL